jgi:hemerythrin
LKGLNYNYDDPHAFPWKEHYQLGEQKIDREHEELVTLLNELHEALQAGKPRASLGILLRELTRAVDKHFRTEEKLMRRSGYPGLDAHRRQHKSFARKLHGFQEQFQGGHAGLREPLLLEVKDWLRDHLLLSDKPLGQHLRPIR